VEDCTVEVYLIKIQSKKTSRHTYECTFTFTSQINRQRKAIFNKSSGVVQTSHTYGEYTLSKVSQKKLNASFKTIHPVSIPA